VSKRSGFQKREPWGDGDCKSLRELPKGQGGRAEGEYLRQSKVVSSIRQVSKGGKGGGDYYGKYQGVGWSTSAEKEGEKSQRHRAGTIHQ